MGGKLSRRHIDSTGGLGAEEIIVSDANYNFTVDGDWVYYVSGYSIYKVRTDGTGKELMEKDGQVVIVVDDGWLYGHTVMSGRNEVFRINIESGSKEMLYTLTSDVYTMAVQGLGIQDGKVYFASVNDWDEGAPEAIYRMNTDGTGLETLLTNESGGFFSCNLLKDQLVVECFAGYNSSYWYYYIGIDLVTGEQVIYGR